MPEKHRFMQTLLDAIERKTANTAVLSGAWHLAVRSKDINAMAVIAGAENLPSEVLTAVKARNEIPVAVAYLTRGGLSADERKARLEAENRAGVLAGVLQSASVTDADRQVLADKLVAKPTRALAEAAIADQAMPLYAVVVAITQLDPRQDQLTDTQRTQLRKAVERCARDASAAATVSRTLNVSILANRFLAQKPELSQEQFEELFRRTIVPSIRNSIDTTRNQVNAHRIVAEVKHIVGDDATYHSETVLKVLRELLDAEQLSKIWTDVVGATRAMADTADVSDHSARVLAARESSDRNQLEALVDEALSGNGALVEPLLRNMALDQHQLTRVVATVDTRTIMRLLEMRPGDEHAALIAYQKEFERVMQADEWKAFKDRRWAEEQLLGHHIKMWQKDQGAWYSGTSGTLMSIINELTTTELLSSVPWEFYQIMTERYGIERLSGYVSEQYEKHLGNDLHKWETAQVLSEGFSGSIGELMGAAASL